LRENPNSDLNDSVINKDGKRANKMERQSKEEEEDERLMVTVK
jgi:hypothetical protein